MTDLAGRERSPTAREVLDRHAGELLSNPNVSGVGVREAQSPDGSSREVIQVYVRQQDEGNESRSLGALPDQLDGIEVCISEIGALKLE